MSRGRARDAYNPVAMWRVLGAILLPEMAMAMLESTLPLWLIHTMHPAQWQLGGATIHYQPCYRLCIQPRSLATNNASQIYINDFQFDLFY